MRTDILDTFLWPLANRCHQKPGMEHRAQGMHSIGYCNMADSHGNGSTLAEVPYSLISEGIWCNYPNARTMQS